MVRNNIEVRGRTPEQERRRITARYPNFLGGFIVVEAENLDGALAVAGDVPELRGADAIEIRPVREEDLVGA